MARRITTDVLVSEVRSLLDEDNIVNISDDLDIIPALNRAQDVASNILARQYDTPLIVNKTIQLDNTNEFEIPEDAFEERIEKVEVLVDGRIYQEVPRISYRDVTYYDHSSGAAIPQAYAVFSNTVKLYPSTVVTYPIRIWYMKDPAPLVSVEGRITNVNSNSLVLDSLGSNLTTDAAELNNYVNLIDGDTGEVKATMQVIDIDSTCNKITFKSTFAVEDRTTVLNRTISDAVPATVEPDDYVCLIHGSCVPYLRKPNTNFLIQHAVNDIKINKLGEPGDMLLRLVDKLEQAVERSWVGRETTLRVKSRNINWTRSSSRRWRNQ